MATRLFKREAVPRVETVRWFGPQPFSQSGPTDLEIGCGVGMHPIQYAQKNPDRNLIAIEHTRDKFEKFQRRFSNHGNLQNLTALHTNAISWVTHFCPSESIERIFLLYPNPEHQNPAKRWFLMPFFSEILRVLKPAGEILLATNEQGYRDEALERAEQKWNLNLTNSREMRAQDVAKGRTHFEIKYLKRGETCFELRFSKDRTDF